MTRTLAGIAAFIGIALLNGCSRGAEFPSRPITLICPWSPGGGTDLVSRQMAALLQRELGVPVTVINATGGGGVTGHTRGALARPDGYTLTMITVELNMLHWQGRTSISPDDFRPAVLLNQDAAALFVRQDAPWKTAGDLAEEVKARPGSVKASGTAHGGVWHLALAGWLRAIGQKPDDMIWISINGAGPSLQELLAGGVSVVCCSLPEARPLMDAGRIRSLGVMADERVEPFESVPTLKEAGFDWALGGWRGVAMPARTPDAVAEKLTAALTRVVRGTEFRGFMQRTGFDWSYGSPSEFSELLRRRDAQFGALLTSEAFRSMARRPIGPMVFPGVLLGLALLVLILLIARGELGGDSEAGAFSRRGLVHCGEAILFVAAYVALVEWAGFVVTVCVLLTAWMGRLGVRWPVALGLGSGLGLGMYQLFAGQLRVPLPPGWLGW